MPVNCGGRGEGAASGRRDGGELGRGETSTAPATAAARARPENSRGGHGVGEATRFAVDASTHAFPGDTLAQLRRACLARR
jgi:hypothetical protein